MERNFVRNSVKYTINHTYKPVNQRYNS